MLYMLLATVLAAAIGFFVIRTTDKMNDLLAVAGFVLGAALILMSVLSSAAMVVVSFDWVASERKAEILNAEYGTSYTREDVFYASSVIDTIREIDRKRVEVNGNLVTGEDKE